MAEYLLTRLNHLRTETDEYVGVCPESFALPLLVTVVTYVLGDGRDYHSGVDRLHSIALKIVLVHFRDFRIGMIVKIRPTFVSNISIVRTQRGEPGLVQ